MEVYAAQIDRMDQGIGRILAALEETGQMDNTLIIFLSDNGACAEDIPQAVTARELVDQLMIAEAKTRDGKPVRFGNDPTLMPGAGDTYQSYGTAWANLSNTPFRLYIHEGGIATIIPDRAPAWKSAILVPSRWSGESVGQPPLKDKAFFELPRPKPTS